MIFFCVKVGTKYSSQVVNNLYNQLDRYYSGRVYLHCLTDDDIGIYNDIKTIKINKADTWKKLQWHKTSFFRKNFNGFNNDEEVIVCDIDIEILKNIDKLVDFPINRFAAARRWWMLEHGQMSGTWYKFKIGDLAHVDTQFDKTWQEYWVQNKLVAPPVNGEQNYVEGMVESVCEIDYFPDTWFTKWTDNDERNRLIQQDFYKLTNDMLYFGTFHEYIKIVHYAGYNR